MNSVTELPVWLFEVLRELKASYNPKYDNARSNLYADDEDVQGYLGTYFPRSYCEVFCIMENLFKNPVYNALLTNNGSRKEEINILDIGCGTGGDIVGLLSSLNKYVPLDVSINVQAFDGNQPSLDRMKDVVAAFNANCRPLNPIRGCKYLHEVKSESDLLEVAKTASAWRFDFILCCKLCNELMFHHYVAEPYLSVARNFSGMLKQNGVMLILDPTDRFSEDDPYLPTEMNRELHSFFSYLNGFGKTFGDEFGTLVPKPCGDFPWCNKNCYTQKQFTVIYPNSPIESLCFSKNSKVCYRIICRKMLWNKLNTDSVPQKLQYISEHGVCQLQTEDMDIEAFDGTADAFDINS